MTNYNPNPFRQPQPQSRSTGTTVIITLVGVAAVISALITYMLTRPTDQQPVAAQPTATTVVISHEPSTPTPSTHTTTVTATPPPVTVTVPDTQETTSTREKCDGRYILIVHSALAAPGTYPQEEISTALSTYPGSQVGTPGFCSSIRGQLNGHTIYPIYIDYGHNAEAACAGKTQHGGNVRSLNTRSDFSAPC
ncbi:MAG: hypothetical protein Q4A31_10680 [Corynebacterium sp.]|uniref:hypothetical protein n=1 Tax=Corynebacterium sp. TaxID=1720 RepID=UPI0026DBC216|nr:hypothetical protein [Corynebacterium sp.]MDO4762373.1 hypothetical protein [Corynebacterium sp.]